MSKISELGPITGANTRTEDLFVIVNLIQGDDGTKNITRKELVQAIQYEIFDRITITGGTISNVRMFSSTLDQVIIGDSTFNNGLIDGSEIIDVTIDNSDFSNGTGNNNIFTNTIVDYSILANSTVTNTQITDSDFSNGTGNNDVFTNSRIDFSEFNQVTIEGGTANNLVLTNITIDQLVLEDALISNSNIITTSFSNGTIYDTGISNSTIINTDLDDVDITNSRFSNGQIWDTEIANSNIINTNLDTVVITNSVFANGSILDTSANNMTITNSDFSDGTGNNNVFTNTTVQGTVQDSVIANSSFQGTMDGVVAQNMQISSSSADGLSQTRSTFDGGSITNSDMSESNIANSTIDNSTLVDFDMDIKRVFEAPIDEDSYFALKNIQTGETERMTYRQLYDEFSRKTEKSLKVYVASDGHDENDGTILKPVRTLKRAEELALEKAGGSYDRNDINNAVHISVGPGTYYVDEPIMLPDDCSLTSTAGQYATVIQKKLGWERTNGILVGSGNYVQGFSYMNFEVDNFDQPEGGFAIAYRPGALLRRSPYIRDSSQLSNFNRLDVEPPLNPFNSKGTILDLGQEFYLEPGHSPQSLFEVDDEVTFSSGATGYVSYIADIDSNRQIYVRNLKGNVEPGDILYAQRGGIGTIQSIGIDDFPNRLVGRGGGCLLADRAVLDTDSLYTYVLCFGFTPRTQNGTGYVAKNGAGVNGIGSLSIFTRQAFFALDGGQMTLNNSGSQFGDISMRARGSTVIIRPADANATNLIANSAFADVIETNKDAIIDDMIEYLTANTTSGGLGYEGYNADKCFRDTGIIVDNTGYDIATNSNYWGRLNGITYRSPISYVVVNEQLDETVGSIEHLKDSINFIFENANTEVRNRVDASLNETLNILQNGEEFANNIIFADTGNGPATAARELVQDNREFIIEEFIDWLDNNEDFYAYDSAKCKRDVTEFILPAVKYDTMLDTNYNSVTAGNAYYFKAAKNVIGAQREETVAAYERLRKTTDDLVEPISSSFAVQAYEKFNEIINILKMEGDKFTPTAATYTPTTGEFVMTIPAHGLEVGRYILLSPEAFTFTCDTDNNVLEYKHPRATDPAFKSALPIISATTDTITVNVGSTGYAGVHTLKAVADNAVIVIGNAIEFSDNSAIPADRRNARKQLQANRQFIQDYMMTWADNEWFFYDSAKCQRDMKNYIVPAVLRDMQTGTNFNAIQSGIAYRSGIAKVAVNEQLTETIGAIGYLANDTENLLADPVSIHRVSDAYGEIINIAQNSSKKYTPSNASYNPATGIMVATIGSHDFQLGDTIIIEKESITFSCPDGANNVNISHPRETDPAFNTPLPILEKTDTTITVNVGDANGYTGVHTFVSAADNAIREAGVYDGKFTPLDADYDPISGDITITIGQHNLPVGKWISIADEAITLSCANTVANTTVEISHPRATDPAFRQPVRITAVTNNSITVNVGNANGYTGEHTFVSALVDSIDTNAIYWTDPAKIASFHTPTDATYDPATGEMVITLGNDHGFTTGDHIEFKPNSMVFSCANTVANTTVEISHPRIGEPNYQFPLEVTATSNTTITVNPGAANGYTGAHTFLSAEAGAIIKTPASVTRQGKFAADKLQENRTFLQDEVDAWIRDNYFVYNDATCSRDTGLILDAVRRDIATGSNINSVFSGLAYRSGNATTDSVIANELTETVGALNWLKGEIAASITSGEGQTRSNEAFDTIIGIMQHGVYTPTDATYDPVTGVAEITIGTHNFTTGDEIYLKPESLTFSCGSPAVEISHPRPTDPSFNSPLTIAATSSTTITVNVGAANGYTGAHTFVRAEDRAVVTFANRTSGTGFVSDEAYEIRSALLANKNFIIDEAAAFIRNKYPELNYDRAKCQRDIGWFVDSVAWDIQHGSNAATVNNSRLYFDGAVSILPVEERPKTAETFEFVAELAGQIARNEVVNTSYAAYDVTNATYDPVTGLSEITIGSHDFKVGDSVRLDQESLTFECGSPAVQISHPRVTDPAYNTRIEITAVTDTTITLNVGDAGGYTGAHTFVSAEPGAVKDARIQQVRGSGTTFTPTFATYDPVTGLSEITLGDHQFNIGDRITIKEGSMVFECGSPAQQIAHPRSTDPAGGDAVVRVTAKTATTITVDVGDAGGYTGVHTFVSAEAGCVRSSDYFNVTTATYNPTTGVSVITIGNHNLQVGERIMLAPESLTFSCGSPAVEISHPRATDPAYNTPVIITATTADTITVNVGDAGGYTGAHTFVSADPKAVRKATTQPTYTPTTATYDPTTGVSVITIGNHTLGVGDWIIMDEEGLTFSCANTSTGVVTNISHPRVTDPYHNRPVEVLSVDATSITINVGAVPGGSYAGVHTFVSAKPEMIRKASKPEAANDVVGLFKIVANMVRGNDFAELPAIKEPALIGTGYDSAINTQYERIAGVTAKYQKEIINFIREEYNGLGFNTDLCYRDTGLIIDAITEDMEYGGDAAAANAAQFYFNNAVNILPYEQRKPTRLAFEHLATVAESVVRGIAVTPTTGNTTTQITSGNTADAATGARAKALFNIVSDVVDNRPVIEGLAGSLDITQKTPEELPTETAAPLIEPSRTFARKSLQKNKTFIQDEVVAFINDKYFVYNEGKCQRDAGYILDAVKRDVQTGADYNSRVAGKVYRAGTAGTNVVVQDQLAETIEAIKWIKKDIASVLTGTALTRANTAFDNVVDAMVNDYSADTPNYTFGTAQVSTSGSNAKDGLQLNRAFLKAEAIAYINLTFGSLTYNTAKCSRDIGYMVDAVSYDILHGSNVAIRDVARLYFENGNSVLPADQRIPTAAAFTHIASVAELLLLKASVTPTAGNILTPSTAFGTVDAATAQNAQNLLGIVANVITANSLVDMPAAVEATTTATNATGYDYEADVATIEGRKASVQANINKYLKDTFDYLEYDQVKCRRDIGYMVDAISHDIQYGGNSAMWNAAQIYFVNAVNLLPIDQRDATREAFTRMANVIHDVIRNETVVKTSGNTSTQYTSYLTARREIAAEARDLGLMVANIADDNNPDNLPSRIEPNTNWMPSVFITEKDKVDNSLETLVTNMINFISEQYNGISYPKEKCRRDVGIIVDALSHDVQYQTNYATRLCANMYFDNATSVLPFDQRKQTADFYVEMANLVKDVIQELATGQDVSGTPATAVEAEWAADMVRIIEEAIRRNGLDALPEIIEPDTSWVDVNEVTAGEAIDSQLDELADDVTKFIADNFTIVDYSKAKCRRDSGYILDAMSWDLNYGGNLASRWNADFYFWNNQLRIPENTRVATAQSYRKLGEIVSKVVTGSYPGQLMRPELGSADQAKQAYDLGLIFYNALFYNTPKALGPTIKPNLDWEADKTFKFARDILGNNKTKLQREVQRFITAEYKFIDLPKTYRDAENLLKTLQNEFRYINPATGVEGSDKSTRSYVGALFNINAQHVFPVFNPPASFADWRKLRFKGTVADATARDALTNMKRWDCYIIPINNNGNRYIGNIWYWTGTTWASAGANNTDLLEAFLGAWERMRDYINTNVANDADQRAMITELIDRVLIDSVIRPNFLVFGSLVESIAHQFNGASAGVNRNALPLNFRNVGAAIGANASVLSENGGRIRWSGSDELNNQYFARGLKINGRTGRIEGRPFTSSVRKLARRASNSRATL